MNSDTFLSQPKSLNNHMKFSEIVVNLEKFAMPVPAIEIES